MGGKVWGRWRRRPGLGSENSTSHFSSCEVGIMPPALRALPFSYSLT